MNLKALSPEHPVPLSVFGTSGVHVLVDLNYFRHLSRYFLNHSVRKQAVDISGLTRYALRKLEVKLGCKEGSLSVESCRAYIGGIDLAVIDGQAYSKGLSLSFQKRLREAGVLLEFGEFDGGKEVDIDSRIRRDLNRAAADPKSSAVVLIAGDGGFSSAVDLLSSRIPVALVSMDQRGPDSEMGCNPALRRACTLPINLEDIREKVSCREDPWIRDIFLSPQSWLHAQGVYRA